MARIGLVQSRTGIDPQANAEALVAAIAELGERGAEMIFTPEMSGLLDRDSRRLFTNVREETEDVVLAAVREAAKAHRVWVALGSLALKDARVEGRLVNRSFLVDDEGAIRARYDKIHLFDVEVADGESYRESRSFAPGGEAVLAGTPLGPMGLSICYDVRFPRLYDALSSAGAVVLAVPAAFTRPTGRAHWHMLLRARAVENAAFLVAAAQAGEHEDGRATYGHSLVVDPWGEVLLDMGEAPGLATCDLDLRAVDAVRARLPVLQHRTHIKFL